MKSSNLLKTLLPVALIATFGFNACKEATNNAQTLSEEDLEVVQMVISESLSDKNEGLMTDLYDIQANLNFGSLAKSPVGEIQNPPEWRSGSYDHSRAYDPENGTHTVAYRRAHIRGDFSKTMSFFSQYVFLSLDGAFVQFPGREEVESISFYGKRVGTITTPFRSSEFDREARWTASGLISSEYITLSGTQNNTGSMSVVNPRGDEISRNFSLSMTMSDVSIENSIQSAQDLEDKVTGIITYEIHLIHTVNGETREKHIEGSIELEGNGLALLRLMGSNAIFRVNLSDGTTQRQNPPGR